MDEELYNPDYDEDAALGIPSGISQRVMLSEAVVKAARIQQELALQVDGMLAEYVQHALNDSAEAAAQLLTMHPKDERELFELQKRAAPYASVMEWIRNSMRAGMDAQQQIEEIDNQERLNAEEE